MDVRSNHKVIDWRGLVETEKLCYLAKMVDLDSMTLDMLVNPIVVLLD